MPPQGLLVIAAAAPKDWQVRFIDENIDPATADDFAWAEVVFVSGMHIQRDQIHSECLQLGGKRDEVARGAGDPIQLHARHDVELPAAGSRHHGVEGRAALLRP